MIVGFNIDSMDASKEGGAGGNLKINYRPEITDVEEVNVSAIDGEVARISFSFKVSYMSNDSEAAHITMDGNVLWNSKVDEVIEEWDENEQLLEDIRAPLMNELYRRLLSESVGVANTLGLLPPIPTPQVDN